MQLDRIAIRNKTTFYVSFPASVLFFVLAWIALDRGDWLVFVANAFAGVFLAGTGYLAGKENAPAWLPYPFMVFLLILLNYLIFTEYHNGVVTAWMLAVPPLAFLTMGTRPGLLAVLLLFPALAYGLLIDDFMNELVSVEYRGRLLVTYGLIAGVCFAFSASFDWYEAILTRQKAELDQMKRLVPMCAHCKQVRVGETWHEIEEYITEQQEVQVSHGICPVCLKLHY